MRIAVLNVVGLSESLLPLMPRLSAFARRSGYCSYPPEFPAVTCTAQSAITTGRPVSSHGIVANGWYDRESAETRFWKQSNAIVRGPKLWDYLRASRPEFTCANTFWWYNMHSSVDFSVTPRPLYPADGRKVFDIHTQPMGLRDVLKQELGEFPFPSFWGPAAGIASSRWIASCARWIEDHHQPSLHLVYLPHLDYPLQKNGPNHASIPSEAAAIDAVAADLIEFFETRGVTVRVLSEYGISPVSQPVHLNRLFRERGWLSLKNELGRETLDCGGCKVFALADHQVAHVYVADPALRNEVHTLLTNTAGVADLLAPRQLWGDGVAADRAGDWIAVAEPDAWFTYYFWQDDTLAPDYARTIDIHRKPGYDPCELWLDPKLRWPKLRIAAFLARKRLGLRGLLEVIPLDATLVRGSHGRADVPPTERPLWIGPGQIRQATDIHHQLIAEFHATSNAQAIPD